MKEIQASINADALSTVVIALQKMDGVAELSIYNINGMRFERGESSATPRTVRIDGFDYVPQLRLSVIVSNQSAGKAVTVIRQAAGVNNIHTLDIHLGGRP